MPAVTETLEIPQELAHGLQVNFEREDDGRWIAEVPSLPGVLARGATREAAANAALALALRALADRLERAEVDAKINAGWAAAQAGDVRPAAEVAQRLRAR